MHGCILVCMNDEPMKPHNIKMPDDLWERAQQKAGLTPLSAIIRRLIKMWLDGEIEIKI